MQVTVKTLDSETRVFTVADEATVEEFKQQIASDVNIPPERQRLIFKGKVLQDSAKLQSYGVDGCVIHLVERRPPSQRSNPDGASSERSTHDHSHGGDGPGFNLPTDVMNISQQIVQGLVSQLGLNAAQANVSTTQSGDGSTLNVHINLLASANAANDASIRISRARQFLQAARNSLNRPIEGDSSVLPGSASDGMDTSSSTSNSQQSTTTSSQQSNSQSQTTTNTNQNNSAAPGVLANVLGQLLEFNTTIQPYIQRYITLLNSNGTENLLPSDDSLPDRIAESLHNISHAYHALSDLTFNFRSPEPRQLSVLPSLSSHIGANPFLSSLFAGGQPPQPPPTQPGQQPSQTQSDARIHVVPGGSAIAFTSIISGAMPPSSIYNPQPNATSTSGPNRMDNASMFSFNFGNQGNTPTTSGTNTSTGSTTTTSSQSTTQGGGSGDNVRIVMDDFVALFSSSHPVTSHSETSRTNTASQQSSTNNTDTQTQNSGSTASTARTVPRINIRSLPLVHGNHHDPLVPCESFHFGPRSRQPQGISQPGGNPQGNLANGLAQAFSEAVASALQESMAAHGEAGSRGDQTSSATTQTAGNTTTSSTSSSTGSTTQTSSSFMTGGGSVNPYVQLLSAINAQNQQPVTTSQSTTTPTAAQRNTSVPPTREFELIQNAVLNSIGQAVRGEESSLTLHDFLHEVDEAMGGSDNSAVIQGPLISRLMDRFGRTMSLQDLILMLMGVPEPYSRLRSVVRQYLLTDLLNGTTPSDENIQNAAAQLAEEFLSAAGDLLDLVQPAEGVDVKASVSCFLESSIKTALTMSRDLDDAAFAARFPEHAKQSSTDLCILLAMCFQEGVRGATNFVGMRLPETMTRDVNPLMLQTLQATAVSFVQRANQQRPQREGILRQYIKQAQPQPVETPATETEQQTQAETCDANSQQSDDSDAFATPPLSMSANDNDEYAPLEEEDEEEEEEHEHAMELDENDEWKTVVPGDWVPIIARDVIKQRRLPQQAPFSDAYLSGFPPKRRKTADERAMSSTSENVPSMLRQAVRAAGVTPRTSMEALEADARQSTDLHQGFRQEVQKAVKTRTSKDEDYTPDLFPATKDYIEKS